MQFSILATALALATAAAATAVCPAERPTPMCCNYLATNQANPDQPIPWSCQQPSTETTAEGFKSACTLNVGACCVGSSLTPRGYTGSDCALIWSKIEPSTPN